MFLSQTSLLYLKLFISFFYKPHKNNTNLNSSKNHLILSFKRSKFFPNFISQSGHTYCGLSLGSFLRFFIKPKSFKKSKSLYILLINFFRKVFFYSLTINLVLVVKFIPKYFSEIINILTTQNPLTDTNPFTSGQNNINAPAYQQNIYINNIIFLRTKHYGFVKIRKKGVVKRKISRKVLNNNLVLD